MSQPYDASVKHLITDYPKDWLRAFGMAEGKEVELIDADLATVTTAADKIIKVLDTPPWLAHMELQAGRDDWLAERTLRYNVLAYYRQRMNVESTVVLLQPEADTPKLTGLHRVIGQSGEPILEFRYRVVRLWELSPETLLRAGFGTYPLLPLCNVNAEALPAVIQEMKSRLDQNLDKEEREVIWTASFVLMGLRFSKESSRQLLQGVGNMKESVTYQGILEEGKAEGEAIGSLKEARKMLLRIGTHRFQEPDPKTLAAIEGINNLELIEFLADKAFVVSSWKELLDQAWK